MIVIGKSACSFRHGRILLLYQLFLYQLLLSPRVPFLAAHTILPVLAILTASH